MHPQSHQFGTDVERVPVEFGDFLKSLQMDDGPHPYLTTQYAEQDLDALTVLPPPADALADDYPRIPRLMGSLYLQQVNLWLGKSKEGSTSGLVRHFSLKHTVSQIADVQLSIMTFMTTCTVYCKGKKDSSCIPLPKSNTSTRTGSWTQCTKTA